MIEKPKFMTRFVTFYVLIKPSLIYYLIERILFRHYRVTYDTNTQQYQT